MQPGHPNRFSILVPHKERNWFAKITTATDDCLDGMKTLLVIATKWELRSVPTPSLAYQSWWLNGSACFLGGKKGLPPSLLPKRQDAKHVLYCLSWNIDFSLSTFTDTTQTNIQGACIVFAVSLHIFIKLFWVRQLPAVSNFFENEMSFTWSAYTFCNLYESLFLCILV